MNKAAPAPPFSGLGFSMHLFAALPRGLQFGLSSAIAFVLRNIIGYRKRVVETNLKNAFPEKNAFELQKIAKAFYLNLTDVFIETLMLQSMGAEEIKKRVRITNPEVLQQLATTHRHLVYVCGHNCNWEWEGVRMGLELDRTNYIVYKSISNPIAERETVFMRSRLGNKQLLMKHAYRTLLADKENPFMVCLASDQAPHAGESKFWCNFLNQPTSFFLGAEKIATSFSCPVMFGKMRRSKRGHYTIELILITENAAQLRNHDVTLRHVAILEELIREQPSDWLWSHKRWKVQPPTDFI